MQYLLYTCLAIELLVMSMLNTDTWWCGAKAL